MSDFINKAKDTVGDVVDKAKDSGALDKVEDVVEDQAEKGGTLGAVADKADDAIDGIQGTKD